MIASMNDGHGHIRDQIWSAATAGFEPAYYESSVFAAGTWKNKGSRIIAAFPVPVRQTFLPHSRDSSKKA